MTRSKKSLTREPIDRRRVRLIQAMLAFPAAGLIGFTGTALVRGVLSDDSAIAAPVAPGHATDDEQTPGERPDESSAEPDPSINRARIV
jgi:hypothetical protein